MDGVNNLGLFVAAGLLLNLTPGPDVLYIVTHAMRRGARAGMVAALGISAGCFVHIAAAALGVSALMAASNTAFALLKWVGAAYLVYVGVRLLLSKPAALAIDSGAANARPARASGINDIFFQGFWTNVLNPKVALFFLAFVPQFITPGAHSQAMVFLLLGLLFNINALGVNFGWALVSSWLARRLGSLQKSLVWLDRAAGAMFISFGLKLALSDSPST